MIPTFYAWRLRFDHIWIQLIISSLVLVFVMYTLCLLLYPLWFGFLIYFISYGLILFVFSLWYRMILVGSIWYCLVWIYYVWLGLIGLNLIRLIQCDLILSSFDFSVSLWLVKIVLVRFNMVWVGSVQIDIVQFELILFGLDWTRLVRFDLIWFSWIWFISSRFDLNCWFSLVHLFVYSTHSALKQTFYKVSLTRD